MQKWSFRPVALEAFGLPLGLLVLTLLHGSDNELQRAEGTCLRLGGLSCSAIHHNKRRGKDHRGEGRQYR